MFQSLQSCIILCILRQINAKERRRFRAPPACDLSFTLASQLPVLPLKREKILSLFCRLGESLITSFSDYSGSDDDIHRNRSPKSDRMTHPVDQITKGLPGRYQVKKRCSCFALLV